MGSILKSKGFTDTIHPWHWNEGWLMRKHAHILGADGSILEITRADEYIRISASGYAPSDKPYLVHRFISRKYPMRPKTDFYLKTGRPAYMSATEISTLISSI